MLIFLPCKDDDVFLREVLSIVITVLMFITLLSGIQDPSGGKWQSFRARSLMLHLIASFHGALCPGKSRWLMYSHCWLMTLAPVNEFILKFFRLTLLVYCPLSQHLLSKPVLLLFFFGSFSFNASNIFPRITCQQTVSFAKNYSSIHPEEWLRLDAPIQNNRIIINLITFLNFTTGVRNPLFERSSYARIGKVTFGKAKQRTFQVNCHECYNCFGLHNGYLSSAFITSSQSLVRYHVPRSCNTLFRLFLLVIN